MMTIDKEWRALLEEVVSSKEILALKKKIEEDKACGLVVYPPLEEVFKAFRFVSYNDVKGVILGQDPYHGPGQAEGLAFSVRKGIPIPPSLKNIHKELNRDLRIPIPTHGSLERWARQLLLLNCSLTVLQNQPASHSKIGWQYFTKEVLRRLLLRQKPLVFFLWGTHAKQILYSIEESKRAKQHLFLEAAHPSPLSAHAGFFGCGHFSKANIFLESNGLQPIDWRLD